MFQRPRSGHDDTHEHDDNREDDSALRMIRQGVEDLGAGENVEANQQDVVGEQHEARPLVSNSAFAEDVVAKVADVSDLGVLHDVLVHGNRGDPEEDASADHGDDAGNPTKYRKRPSLSHDGKTDLVTAEQPGCLLP